jgi:hypothetical protein
MTERRARYRRATQNRVGPALVSFLILAGACDPSAIPSETGAGGSTTETDSADRGGNAGSSANAGSSSDAGAGALAAAGAGTTEPSFSCKGQGALFATGVASFEFGAGQAFGQDQFPDIVLGGPRGGGCCAGSLDVTSLGDGGYVVLEFQDNVIVDGPGADFIVFENPFQPDGSDPSRTYAELGTVSVSADGESWATFECSARTYPYGDCAGWRPVFANVTDGAVAPLDPASAGGDAFDLALVGLDFARYVKVEDVPESEGGAGTFDLDAVGIVNAGCP